MEAVQTYQYQPLTRPSEIRILHLLSKPGQNLYCEIKHVQLPDPATFALRISNLIQPFIALSYEWGDKAKTASIAVIGKTGQPLGTIPLTNNLYTALCDLRDAPNLPNHKLWIDQITINQDDIAERNSQIALMDKIYTGAATVISYLGPEGPADENASKLIERILAHYNYANVRDETIFAARVLDLQDCPNPFPIHLHKETWEEVWKILLGPYTRRLWMVQETCMNPNIWALRGSRFFYGRVVSFLYLLQAAKMLAFSDYQVQHWNQYTAALWIATKHSIQKTTTYDLRKTELRTLSELMDRFCGLMECTNKKDRVYALMGMASDTADLGIVVDYNRSLEEILLDVAKKMMAKQGLRPLEFWNKEYLADGMNLPSWTPRWTRSWNEYSHSLHHENDAGGSRVPVTFLKGKKGSYAVKLTGVLVTTIAETTGDFPRGLLAFRYASDYEHFVWMFSYISKALGKSLFTAQSLCRAITDTADWLFDSSAEKVFDVVPELRTALQNAQMEDGTQQQFQFYPLAKRLAADSRTFIERLAGDEKLHNRAICITHDKQICLAPGHAQPGDFVTILLGGRNLYVLRPIGNSRYLYIGDGSMTGLMRGQVFKWPNYQQRLQQFQLV
jgi:hypothetical protein